jgi:hypothetical protein
VEKYIFPPYTPAIKYWPVESAATVYQFCDNEIVGFFEGISEGLNESVGGTVGIKEGG